MHEKKKFWDFTVFTQIKIQIPRLTPVIAADSEQRLPSKKAVLPPPSKDLNCSTSTEEGWSPEEVETETNGHITRQCHQENLQ